MGQTFSFGIPLVSGALSPVPEALLLYDLASDALNETDLVDYASLFLFIDAFCLDLPNGKSRITHHNLGLSPTTRS